MTKTILFLAANPSDTEPLVLIEEYKKIKEKLERSSDREQFELELAPEVRVGEFLDKMLEIKPQIVHFSGHGIGFLEQEQDKDSSDRKLSYQPEDAEKPEGIVFEDEHNQTKLVSGGALADLFEHLGDRRPQCVVLNCCYSQVQAEEIVKHVPYVIGMNRAIGDRAAIKFSEGFYSALFANESYQKACEFGRILLKLEGIPEHLTPVLLEKPRSLDIEPPNPPHDSDYHWIIEAIKGSRLIPFLGAAINLYNEPPINDIELVNRLIKSMQTDPTFEDLSTVPCPMCQIMAANEKILGELTKEQRLAAAKMYLQYLAEYNRLSVGSISPFYEKLYEEFQNQYQPYQPNYLHDFFARLPRRMLDKSYPLPYKLLVTTNYDNLLEQAFKNARQPYDLVFYVAEGIHMGKFKYKKHGKPTPRDPIADANTMSILEDRLVILKLYGMIGSQDSQDSNFVIAEDHFINYLVNKELKQLLPGDVLEHLQSDLHNVLFLGYSPNGLNLRTVIYRFWKKAEISQGDSWMIHQSRPRDLDKKFWEKRGVKLSYCKLKDFCKELDSRLENLPPKRSRYERS